MNNKRFRYNRYNVIDYQYFFILIIKLCIYTGKIGKNDICKISHTFIPFDDVPI